MTNHHDPVDAWLERDVTPLMPPAGSLERIRHRARRRKRNQVLMAAAGGAVVVAGAAIVPQFAGQGQPGRGFQPTASGTSSHSIFASQGPSASANAPEATHATKIPQTTQPSTLSSSRTVPPPGFRPTSVTFVGADNGTGGVIGAVIGQAGTAQHPCFNPSDCTSLAGTSNYGKSWFGVAAPVTPGTTSASGVSQLRFVSPHDGWAFGPGLWATTGGGWPWTQESTYGMRVLDVEGTGQRAFAIFASCTGPTTSYARDCTSFALYTTTAGSGTWTPVAVPAAFRSMKTGAASSASLVISGSTTAYLLTPSGQVLSGPVAGGAWTLAGKAPCAPGPAQASGAPADALLTAGQSLMLACAEPGAGGQTTVYTSRAGATWTKAAAVPTSGTVTSLGANSTGQVVLATTSGLYYSADSGATWHQGSVAGSPAGGFSYVGLTDSTQAVAIPADSGLGEIFVTGDGGQAWTASPITGR